MNDKIKQLEHLKSRLKKAYSLPFAEQQKWQKQIKELEDQVSTLERELGLFSEDKAINLMTAAMYKVAELAWDDFNLLGFFKKHPDIEQRYTNAEDKVNQAFKTGGISYFEKALQEYIDIFAEIYAIHKGQKKEDSYKQIGFFELLSGDPEYQEAMEVFRNWNAAS
ncbi:hypothetical protein [Caldanaerobius polysaccharolyticus]|uniref:hypothetical protein n=1 Tax=Caldanaerobius polysaccharolyticus TaxID=44256 RepID=UPI00047A9DE4|nr:hypothetical protein [Caldanaerobius polysaccharolyticus]